MNGIDCSVWAPRESNVPDFHRVMSLFDIYSGITGLMLKVNMLWVFILAKNVYQTYLKVFNIYHFLSVDILAQGKIQNSHPPFYSMFCTTLNCVH